MKYAVEVLKSNGIFEDATKTEVVFVENGVELHRLFSLQKNCFFKKGV